MVILAWHASRYKVHKLLNTTLYHQLGPLGYPTALTTSTFIVELRLGESDLKALGHRLLEN